MMDAINLPDLLSDNPKVKYPCSKRVLALAEEDPAALYPDLPFFVTLLDSPYLIIKWTAIDVIGALAAVDRAGDVIKLLDRIAGLLNAGNMITANHAIAALGAVARAKPEYQARITAELLKVERYNYDTVECRNIALGQVVLALGTYFPVLADKKAALAFVERQTANTRPATKKKAEQFLKRHPSPVF
jgi:hypothetical protein